VLVVWATYGLGLSTAKYLGLKVNRFQRPFSAGFQPDLDDLVRRLTSKTRLVVLTNLHNPSGALMTSEVVQEIGKLAAKVGARVLVDEVYLETLYDARPPTAFRVDPEVLVDEKCGGTGHELPVGGPVPPDVLERRSDPRFRHRVDR